MALTKEQKKYIDEADFETLLRRWRFSSSGNTIFQGETGNYYLQAMQDKRDKLSHAEQVATSKRIGWE